MKEVFVRKATIADLKPILKIINNAKHFMKSQGFDQWQKGYPNRKNFRDDIYAGDSYVLMYNHQIAGTASLIIGLEPTYLKIDGKWINGSYSHYATIHRFAISGRFRGHHLADYLMSDLLSIANYQGIHDIRGDTHPKNRLMQHVLLKNGFKKRGVIYLRHHHNEAYSKRWAYQFLD